LIAVLLKSQENIDGSQNHFSVDDWAISFQASWGIMGSGINSPEDQFPTQFQPGKVLKIQWFSLTGFAQTY
jgi:hypothetical protein